MAGNASYDQIATSTLEKYAEKVLRDQIFKSSLFFRILKERRHTPIEGGALILEPILFTLAAEEATPSNKNYGMYTGSGTLNNYATGGVSSAQFEWKQAYASVFITGLDNDIKNTGESAVIKLLEAKMMQAEESLVTLLNGELYSGTGAGNTSLDSINLAVDSAGTYGNINRATTPDNDFWQAIEIAVGGNLVVEGGATSLQRGYDRASKGGGKMAPDFGITTREIHEALESFFTPDRRFTDRAVANFGFESVKFRGAEVVWEEDARANELYFLNTKTFKFWTHPGRNFKVEGPKYPTNQDVKIWHILWAGNLSCNEPRRNVKFTGVTNA